ncbi:hypothetical protein CHL16_24755, partial [Salmonella enterica]|nr:hypothetical protein [Salmonella enterica]
SAWFRHIKSLGWDFIGRIRGTVQFCLLHDGERWLKITDVRGKASPEYLEERIAMMQWWADYLDASMDLYVSPYQYAGNLKEAS